ncbi:glycosyltransferase family 4 protein [Endothiovibrio diazotrophicus]
MSGLRIVVVAHGHPALRAGGGEVAAHNLFQAYRRHPEVEAAWFLARVSPDGEGDGTIRPFSEGTEGEYLIEQTIDDWLLFRGSQRLRAVERFQAWLHALRPDVVHFHHFSHLGIELLRAARHACPDARRLFTLHEFMAICPHNGQMVTTGAHRRCHRDALDACHGCFPEVSREALWLRKRFLLQQLAALDALVAPSRFLAGRYVEWGLPAERMAVIENVQRPAAPVDGRDADTPPDRFGFFGQITPFKGLEVLLRALDLATAGDDAPRIHLELHGANLDHQEPEFREQLQRLAEPLEARGVLGWTGAYEAGELASRMAGIDWVVIPSTWWENSPMVIQEAFAHGRPVLCSDIGGMAEKVRHGVDGLHVAVGSAPRWADALRQAATERALWQRLRAGITPPPAAAQVVAEHLALIRALPARDGETRR